jgi:hypothetical protein
VAEPGVLPVADPGVLLVAEPAADPDERPRVSGRPGVMSRNTGTGRQAMDRFTLSASAPSPARTMARFVIVNLAR